MRYNNLGYIDSVGVSVITCTRRPDSLNNIFENYARQKQKIKELIIILHDNSIDPNIWNEEKNKYIHVRIFQLDENISLGKCLNFAAAHAAYGIIAKFDDDDYYGPKYLNDTIKAFYDVEAEVIGKLTSYVYFQKEKILAIRHLGNENSYVRRIDGPSIIFKKSVLAKVRFRDISRGEDNWFCRDCLKRGIKIFSVNRFHHIYMRHANKEDHTWNIDNEKLLKMCKIISTGEIEYEKLIDC
jgi:cellulose synthase/poly-beta-1,6-N-acetylglucosamine synthase-like glycosyltransferase